MRFGITGGTGFIGQYFLKQYSATNTCIVATSKKDVSNLYTNSNIKYIQSDYSESSFTEIFNECDCIIHLGANRPIKDKDISDEEAAINVAVTQNIYAAAEKNNIKNVVFISSRSVYGDVSNAINVEEVVDPATKYGFSKLSCEEVAHNYFSTKNIKSKILRLAPVFGVGLKGSYLPTVFLDRCVNKKVIDIFGDGCCSREYIYVKDAVYAIWAAANKQDLHGIYNIGSGTLISNIEFAQLFCKIFNNDKGHIIHPERPSGPSGFVMNVSKAKEDLNFSAHYTASESLLDIKQILEKDGYVF